ncbi:MAG: IS4 family transposase [Candidatus Hinthialibacter sp.]
MAYSTSLFSQILSIIPRLTFDRIVHQFHGNRYAKNFSCWDQLVAMLFCQLGQAQSLREICGGLGACLGKLNHLGLRESPKRSTLAHANDRRSWQIYQQLFFALLEQARSEAPARRKFRFKNKLYSLDSSVIDLCASVFDWAHFRRTKGAVKLQILLLDHNGYLPAFACITEGKTHDVNLARLLTFAPGTIVAVDRGYFDFDLFRRWTDDRVYFVTRLKCNTVYEVVEERLPPQNSNVIRDRVIRFSSSQGRKAGDHLYRVVVVWDEENQREIALLTNHLKFGATTIAALYKERWQIEIFFKLLKQNLKVKTFVGTSANALKIQIWTALIAILLLKILQFRSRIVWSLSNLVALLRFNLFTYRDLWTWIDKPFSTPIKIPDDLQPTLFPTYIGQQVGGS